MREQALVVGFEQVIAPIECCPQRPLSGGKVPGALGEQRQLQRESLEQRRRRQHRDPSGGQLERKRHPLEPSADLGDRGRGLVGQAEAGRHSLRPLCEEHDRLVLGEGRDIRRLPQLRQRERWHWIDNLAGEAQHASTCDEHLHSWRRRKQVAQHGGGCKHLLEVVDEQEQLLRPQRVGHGPQQRLSRRLLDVKGLRDCWQHEQRVADRSQLDKRNAVRELAAAASSSLEGESRLADPARAR